MITWPGKRTARAPSRTGCTPWAPRPLGTPPYLGGAGTGGPGGDLRWAGVSPRNSWRGPPNWPDRLAAGLASAVGAAVDVAGGVTESLTGAGDSGRKTPWRLALSWFISSYPLLGALAAAFKLVEDAEVCRLHGIAVAAISPAAAELYVNPLCGFDDGERRFVIAHELLHAGLRHDTRGGGRDPWLWNVACDYVINGWLAEMDVGDLPDSALYDSSLRGKSAEEVYDQIAAGQRRTWKLATLRGPGVCDILPARLARPGDPACGVDLDEFYRRCLADGIDYHRGPGRGLLPAGLVEEIRALTEPPVPWDVELARWFDDHFAPLERRRSYARASRRQSVTPDIPRPGWHVPEELMHSRTFGVVLDTSGSMDRRLLGKALGAIASYAVTRDVPAARVVFCDAEAHDNGFMHPLDIAGRCESAAAAAPCCSPASTCSRTPGLPQGRAHPGHHGRLDRPGPDQAGARVPDPGRSRPPVSRPGTGVPLLLSASLRRASPGNPGGYHPAMSPSRHGKLPTGTVHGGGVGSGAGRFRRSAAARVQLADGQPGAAAGAGGLPAFHPHRVRGVDRHAGVRLPPGRHRRGRLRRGGAAGAGRHRGPGGGHDRRPAVAGGPAGRRVPGRTAGMAGTAVAIAAGMPLAAYAAAIVASTAVTVTRQAQSALIPSVAATPDQLTAANVMAGWLEAAAVAAAGLLAGVLISLAGVASVFAVCAGLGLAAALLVTRLRGAGLAAAGPVAGEPGAGRRIRAPGKRRPGGSARGCGWRSGSRGCGSCWPCSRPR